MEEIRAATPADAAALAPLFDAYRAFFTGRNNVAQSHDFLRERLNKGESVITLAQDHGAVCGFAQLYPLFSSWYAKRIWFLSDLYVSEPARGRGVAKRIIEHVKAFADATGASSVMVELPKAEPHLYTFYEALGFHRDTVFDLARYHPQEGD